MAGIIHNSKMGWGFSPKTMRDLNKTIQRLADASGKAAREVIVPQARLFCTDLAINTLPFGKAAANAVKGKARIISRIDATYISTGAAVNMLKEKGGKGAASAFRRALRNGNFSQAAAIMTRNFPSQWQVGSFDGGRLHWSQRSSRWIRQRMVVTDKPALTEYKREVVKKVGFAKGGFATAARQLGGVRGIPGYASRHNSPGRGIVNDNGKSLSVIILNDVDYIAYALDRKGESRALAYRKSKVDSVLKRMATRKFKSTSRSIK